MSCSFVFCSLLLFVLLLLLFVGFLSFVAFQDQGLVFNVLKYLFVGLRTAQNILSQRNLKNGRSKITILTCTRPFP